MGMASEGSSPPGEAQPRPAESWAGVQPEMVTHGGHGPRPLPTSAQRTWALLPGKLLPTLASRHLQLLASAASPLLETPKCVEGMDGEHRHHAFSITRLANPGQPEPMCSVPTLPLPPHCPACPLPWCSPPFHEPPQFLCWVLPNALGSSVRHFVWGKLI